MNQGPDLNRWFDWVGLPEDCAFETLAPGVRCADGPGGPVTWIAFPAADGPLDSVISTWTGAEGPAPHRVLVTAPHRPPAAPQDQAADLADALALTGLDVVSLRVMLGFETARPDGASQPVLECLQSCFDTAELRELVAYVAALCTVPAGS